MRSGGWAGVSFPLVIGGLIGCISGDPFANTRFDCSDARGKPCDPGFLCLNARCVRVCTSSQECEIDEACLGGACTIYSAACVNDGECAEGWFCGDAGCQKKLPLGRTCARPEMCFGHHCVSGVCCDLSCEHGCQACREDITGFADGTCAPRPAGTDPQNACAGALACDGLGGCFAKGVGQPCTDDFECVSAACRESRCADSVCGDGQPGGQEECDDRLNDGSYGGCNPDCTRAAYCGDGSVDLEYEDCDDGINSGTYNRCGPQCEWAARCGDGLIQSPPETCDDGDLIGGTSVADDGNGCDALCQRNDVCGNTIVESEFETCDDGNTAAGDYCAADCSSITGYCGDRVVQTNEQCDDGDNTGTYDTCNPDCTWPSRCGDGDRDLEFEACDDGNRSPGDYCAPDCQSVTGACGDGTIQINETCDDGGLDPDDGCETDCTIGPRWRCEGQPSRCAWVWFVDSHATGLNHGESWEHAFADLQFALASASAGHQIWVAAGLYTPGSERTDTFQLVDGVELLGGFAGHETEPSQRNPTLYETILSGDLNRNDGPDFSGYDDNAYHVVTGSHTSPATLLDGFTITGGHANAPCCEHDRGAGMLIVAGSPLVRNSVFRLNKAGGTEGSLGLGAAVYSSGSSTTFIFNSFEGNVALGILSRGGAVFSTSSSSFFLNVVFSKNSAENNGSAIHSILSTVTVANAVFTENVGGLSSLFSEGAKDDVVNATFSKNQPAALKASAHAASATSGRVTVANSIVWLNGTGSVSDQIETFGDADIEATYSCIQEWPPDEDGNISMDPRLDNIDSGDFTPTQGSPVLDSGANESIPRDIWDLDADGNTVENLPIDLSYRPRVQNETVDMGAIERDP